LAIKIAHSVICQKKVEAVSAATFFITLNKIMFRRTILKKTLIAASLLWCGFANATLIDNGATTTDTATGYVWADLTATTAYSFNQMTANFSNTSSAFYGYTYATRSDLMTLWNNAGYTGDFYSPSATSGAAITSLFNLFGQTGTNCCARADGMFNDEDSNPQVSFAYLVPSMNLGRILPNYFSPEQIGWLPENQLGSWIYKATSTSVSESSGIALLGLGLAGLLLSRRKTHAL
jgi:hypothetical protein